jgi:hypothetical protein
LHIENHVKSIATSVFIVFSFCIALEMLSRLHNHVQKLISTPLHSSMICHDKRK